MNPLIQTLLSRIAPSSLPQILSGGFDCSADVVPRVRRGTDSNRWLSTAKTHGLDGLFSPSQDTGTSDSKNNERPVAEWSPLVESPSVPLPGFAR